ncbi:hypothetical protein DPMN_076526 [Dreissena polymorpha]|uniref:Uncharacterized protein n=1 Tax=Dreissena polymorpha TaxID=45954 RepID=A0A9D4BQL3_DREPO|nr:hypothetical protein DPMN_076526 [Dreissena polymorpha]
MLVSVLPCYMVVKRGHHPLLIYNDFVETTEQWHAGFAASNLMTESTLTCCMAN